MLAAQWNLFVARQTGLHRLWFVAFANHHIQCTDRVRPAIGARRRYCCSYGSWFCGSREKVLSRLLVVIFVPTKKNGAGYSLIPATLFSREKRGLNFFGTGNRKNKHENSNEQAQHCELTCTETKTRTWKILTKNLPF